MDVDVDKILRRRLYLQRYVTSLLNDVIALNKAVDDQLIVELSEFVLDADDKAMAALGNQRRTNPDAMLLFTKIKSNVQSQRDNVLALMREQMGDLTESEGAMIAAALGEKPPSMRGVASQPIKGQRRDDIIRNAYSAYSTRLISEITQAAMTGPQNITSIVRGSRSEGFRDGLFRWRDNRLRTDMDLIANGVASNAADHVYTVYSVEQVEHLATLDYRTCPSCRAAEMAGPYDIGKQPRLPIHPRCRCVNIPHFPGLENNERPFVEDNRSVKDIPPDERVIGQTRDTIEQFFNRMTGDELREYMGPTRAALWRQGKISSVKDLVNQRTLRPLRLDQLPKL